MIRVFVFVLFFCCSSILIAQNEMSEKHKIVYTNSNNLELIFNKEKVYSNEPVISNKGLELEINSFHGFYLLKRLSLSAGVGLAYHVSEDVLAIPIVGEFKLHMNPHEYDGPFVSLNTGRNLKVGSFKAGSSSKLALGFIIDDNDDYRYVISIFLKSKEYTLDTSTNYNLQTDSMGISLGILF